jgi:ribosome maturation factor RimP
MAKRRKKPEEALPAAPRKPMKPVDTGMISAIEEWSDEAAQAFNLVWFDTEVNAGWVIKVYVDRAGATGPGNGVTIDECALVSRYLEGILDADPEVPDQYRLEVSSPGIERNIANLRQAGLVVGRTVKVVTKEPMDGQNVFEGTLSAVEGDVLHIQGKTNVEVPWSAIAKARTTFDFSGAN